MSENIERNYYELFFEIIDLTSDLRNAAGGFNAKRRI
jgi:hypothetical protein